jgi:hypothetical protein
VRHLLAVTAQGESVPEVATGLVALHGTDPASVFLAVLARMRAGGVGAIERALYDDPVLLRMLGMRRTMFVVPLDLAPIVQAACTRAIAERERSRLVLLLDQAASPTTRPAGSATSRIRPCARSLPAVRGPRRSCPRTSLGCAPRS